MRGSIPSSTARKCYWCYWKICILPTGQCNLQEANFQFPWHFAIFVIRFKPSFEDNHSLIRTKRNFLAKPCNTSKIQNGSKWHVSKEQARPVLYTGTMSSSHMKHRGSRKMTHSEGNLWVFQKHAFPEKNIQQNSEHARVCKNCSTWNANEKKTDLQGKVSEVRHLAKMIENVHVLRKEAEYLANKHMLTIVPGETRSQPNGIVLD